jgi:glutamyl-tRNA synthetase
MEKRPQARKERTVRVRFAPSPTGHLHVGGARTALFNWLFARHQKGVFILRIEDTDRERSTDESLRGILQGMRWLGLDWDEGPDVGGKVGPYQQTQRMLLYNAEIERLLGEDKAYPCFCTREDLDSMRQAPGADGQATFMYDGRCGQLDAAAARRRVEAGEPHVVRLRMPRDGEVQWRDMVRGDVSFRLDLLDDFVLRKSDGHPTYNFAVVVDDAKMHISHVIRGDDHISNTPRQLALYDALGFAWPQLAHLPMIVGSDKTRLSKRHGATSVMAFAEAGILPQAMFNYLALLGWAYDGKREVFSRQELVKFFDLKSVSKTAAVFDVQKLQWMNHEHFTQLSFGGKVNCLLPQMKRHGLWPPDFRVNLSGGPQVRIGVGDGDKIAGSITPISDEEWMRQEPDLVQELPRLHRILEAFGNRLGGPHDVEILRYFYCDQYPFDPVAVEKHLSQPDAAAQLRSLADRLEKLPAWEDEPLEKALRGLAEELGIKAGALIHPTRVALTGQKVSPGIFDILVLLGRPKCLERLRRGADIVEQNLRLKGSGEPGPSASA